MHKAGFVNIVGNPNVGKSTLMNALVGERISIATFKAQTTRHRIMGIYNTDDMQIVFSDTPGVLKPNYKLQESMLNFSTSALTDADVLRGGNAGQEQRVYGKGASDDRPCPVAYKQNRPHGSGEANKVGRRVEGVASTG